MPTRYLKPGIRDSGHIEMLADCPDAECLYYRLLVTVDDFGRFDARPLIIKGQCFPLRVRATADKCMQWLKQLSEAHLILLYVVDSKEYLQITKWDNKPRAESSKFPTPPPSCIQLHTVAPLTVTDVPEPELKPELKPEPIKALSGNGKANGELKAQALEVLEYLNRNTKRNYRPVDANIKLIVARLQSGVTPLQMREVIFNKCSEWADDEKMSEYLRPATLFNATKFEQYIGELSSE